MIPMHMLLAALLGWLEREQRDVIAFLREENRALNAQLGGRRLRLNDERVRVEMIPQVRAQLDFSGGLSDLLYRLAVAGGH